MLIPFQLANQHARKELFAYVVYTKKDNEKWNQHRNWICILGWFFGKWYLVNDSLKVSAYSFSLWAKPNEDSP